MEGPPAPPQGGPVQFVDPHQHELTSVGYGIPEMNEPMMTGDDGYIDMYNGPYDMDMNEFDNHPGFDMGGFPMGPPMDIPSF
jgi:hypothetical protein